MSKYYAVRRGRSTGIFSTWAECSSQVTGFKGAIFKKFNTQAEAAAFVSGATGGAPSSSGPVRSRPTQHTPYDRQTIICSKVGPPNGEPAQPATNCGPVTSYLHDETFRAIFGDAAADALGPGRKPVTFGISSKEFMPVGPDGKQTTRKAIEEHVEQFKHERTTVIYTDGSSLGNGRVGSRAGYGVWFGEDDSRNASGAVCGAQTNNAGELMAIKVALDKIKTTKGTYIIKSDSSYSLDSVTKWADRWERNGWQTANGKAVQNQTLIMDIRKSLKQCKERGIFVSLEKVKGHSNVHGNEMADRLARQGAASGR